jgi:hypothetical protein
MSGLTGGCQCGAVRFRVEGEVRRASICHCRMCQKAMGSPFGGFASVRVSDLVWTRGARKTFQSSEHIARGFCGACGTPLTFEAVAGGQTLGLTICAFDQASAIAPELQIGLEGRLAWLDGINELPVRTPEQSAASAARFPPVASRQHPDHDTETWPPTR